MAKGFKHGSGGSPLNFKVVGNPQPTSHKENTIWVNTDVKIPQYYFVPQQPKNAAEGDVWFLTSQASDYPFNVLKKNSIQVNPLYAKQYVNGAFADVPSMIYQDGNWNELKSDFVIFDISKGGWIAEKFIPAGRSANSGSYREAAPSVTQDTNGSMFIRMDAESHCGIYIGNYTIDLTDYSELYFEGFIRFETAIANTGLCVWNGIGPYWLDNIVARTLGVEGSVTLDIRQITGNHYIGFGFFDNSYVSLYRLILRR